ncbi:uncharacterized protein N7484_009325 [Penicillium longicatenatum]|uniref:uncharacterized protein n=1 Tax=Penicillium longicatenatum TaxID=1561947 RepID=UPI0025489D1E|nr:uncharacterized protein N7484_009325 [Penicillium longicatenatum]KAJ5636012.1 hypothetical protein N7484_009325 [Penicillium longicatenatum]
MANDRRHYMSAAMIYPAHRAQQAWYSPPALVDLIKDILLPQPHRKADQCEQSKMRDRTLPQP